MADDRRVARAFGELAEALLQGMEVSEFLNLLAVSAAELLDVGSAGVLLVGSDDAQGGHAATTPGADTVQRSGLRREAGPIVECRHSGLEITADSPAAIRARWPWLASICRDADVAALQVLPLHDHGVVIGTLGLFSAGPRHLGDSDCDIARALTATATLGILQHRVTTLAQQLQNALDSRVVIEQAKGVLAERHNIPTDDAFSMLRSRARARQIRLADLAQAVLDAGNIL